MFHWILLMIVSSLSYYFKALFSGRPGGRGGGGGGGWRRGISGHLHNDVYKFPLPKTKIV